MGQGWRLIVDGPATGPWNMSVDEALLRSLRQGLAPPTLRLYRWRPATVSLGYFQPAEDADLAALERLGLGLVRRPTGGRAILHDDEMTYSVAVPAAALAGGRSLGRSYREIGRALLEGLIRLGLKAQAGDDKAGRDSLPAACFALSTRADLTAQGRKVIGSAQMRREGCILQHGSIPVTLDLAKHAAVFGAVEEARLGEKACGLADLLGRRPTWDEMTRALAEGFAEALDLELTAGTLGDGEREMAQGLELAKYGHEGFTLGGGRSA